MEFRPMRRSRQLLTPEQAWALLEKGSYGVLAVQGDGGWPYAVPLNYACCGRSIFFHCAKAGHKLDARTAALRALVEKYSPREPEEHKAHEVESCGASCIVAIDVVHITGKQAIELVEK